MGACLSTTRNVLEFEYPIQNWSDWGQHPQLRHYDVHDELGHGAFSQVMLAKKKSTGELVALKLIFLGNPDLSQHAAANLREESDILERLTHPHIVDVRCAHEWRRNRILMIEEELLGGAELIDGANEAIHNFGFTITESWARRVMQQVFAAVAYIHGQGVLHRDIKAENMRFTLPTKEWVAAPARMHLKLIDFGLSCRTSDTPDTGWLGSPGFVAPEVIHGLPHTRAMDCFSCGVVLCMLLTGNLPMATETALELSYANTEAWEHELLANSVRWDAVSVAAQDLVLRLLEREPKKRLTAEQALKHPWMVAAKVSDELCHPHITSTRFTLADVPLSSIAEPGPAPAPSPGSPTATPAEPHAGAAQPAADPPRAEMLKIKESDELAADEPLAATAEVSHWAGLLGALRRLERLLHMGSAAIEAHSPEWHRLVLHAYTHAVALRGYRGAGRATLRPLPLPSPRFLQQVSRSFSSGGSASVRLSKSVTGSADSALPVASIVVDAHLRHSVCGAEVVPELTVPGEAASPLDGGTRAVSGAPGGSSMRRADSGGSAADAAIDSPLDIVAEAVWQRAAAKARWRHELARLEEAYTARAVRHQNSLRELEAHLARILFSPAGARLSTPVQSPGTAGS